MQPRESIERLSGIIGALEQLFPNDPLLAYELRDLLWLTPRVGPRRNAQAPAPPAEPVYSEADAALPEPTGRGDPASPTVSRTLAEGGCGTEEQRLSVYQSLGRTPGPGPTIPAMPVPLKQPPRIPRTRAITRALRPLTKIASLSEPVFDEVATAERYAEQRVFEPVTEASPSRWLRLELIIERTPSIRIWKESIDELQRVLERHSAFRSIRSWNLVDEGGTLEVRTWSRRPRTVRWGELTDTTAPQLVLVVSDCVSGAWTDGRMGELLGTWSNRGPVAVVQVLPPELWHQTGLGNATRTRLRSTMPGAPNSRLTEVSTRPTPPDKATAVNVPVTMLDAEPLTRWASLVAATGGGTAPGYVIPRRNPDDPPPVALHARRPADERVRLFDATATRAARRLARYFAVVTYPLTPPVMRVIQNMMLPGTPNSAIAEIIVGGLMHVDETYGDIESELISYAYPADVRDRLLDGANRTELRRVVFTNVSRYVADCFGPGVDLAALVANENVAGDIRISAKEERFAVIGLSVLERFGSEYRALVERIRGRKEPPGSRLQQWAVPNHPRRPRVDLAAYLGDEEATALAGPRKLPGAFADWMAGLWRWGLPLMIEGVLAMADRVTDTFEDSGEIQRREQLVEFARRCIRERTPALLRQLQQQVLRHAEHDDAWLAASAAQAALESDYPAAEQTQAYVRSAVRAARARLGTDELRTAVVAALRHDLFREESLVPDHLPDRPPVAVAGTRKYELPLIVQQTASMLGQALARAGHHLIAGGQQGVDHIVARSFARELELLGHSPEDRLTNLVEQGGEPNFARGTKLVAAGAWTDEWTARAQAIVTLAGRSHVQKLHAAAQSRQRPLFPLAWTGGASKATAAAGDVYPRYGRATMLAEEPESEEEVRLATNRVVAWTLIATDRHALTAWSRYTDLLRVVLTEELTTQQTERTAPRLHAFLQSLQTELPLPIFAQDTLRELEGAAAAVPEWLVHDLVALAEVEPHALRDRDGLLARLASTASKYAVSAARSWLGKRLRGLTGSVPPRQLDGVVVALRALLGSDDALDRFTRETIGLSGAEATIRALVPVYALEQIAAYFRAASATAAAGPIEAASFALVRLSPSRERVLALVRSADPASRVAGYLLLQMDKARLRSSDLAERLVWEAANAPNAKPLRQLLRAVTTMGRREGDRVIARGMSVAEAALQRRPAVDASGECRRILRGMLNGPLRRASAENSIVDRAAARFWKTLRGKIISARMKLPPLGDAEIGREEIAFLVRHGQHAQRAFAVTAAAVGSRPDADAVIGLIQHADSRGDLHVGCAVAAAIGERLTAAQRERLVDALKGRVAGLRTRGQLAQDLENTIRQLSRGT